MEEIVYNRCDGVISKLTKIAENKYIDKLGIVIDLDKCAILGKTSPNIIDLIEVGDYVNGYKVEEVMEEMGTWKRFLEMTSNYTNKEIGDCTIREDREIKTIVTKEQFKSAMYEVKLWKKNGEI